MKTKLLTTTLAAGVIALSGAAFAQSSPGTTSPSSPGSTMDRPSGAAPGGGSSIDRGAPATSPNAAKPDTPPASIVGKDVVNAAGDKIGEIKSVSGKQVIVGVGGFLGMGERQVALDWAQLTMTGAGEDAKLKTSMTKDQLKELPEHKAEGATGSRSGSSSSPSGSRGGGTTR